ncbi:hypothetical protein [Streptomyces collinus]|uniref:hypothetical protein n=1 Tax=Streptomyces collinus TaxID=42684 RepID=UPI0029437BF9|nr:hypothetical protein [Streptomyces collinus]
MAYLLAHQQADGGYTSRPEQAALRPIPYYHPAHPAVFALTALGELHHTCAAQRGTAAVTGCAVAQLRAEGHEIASRPPCAPS